MKILAIIHYPFNRNAGAAGVIWRLGQEYEKLGHQVEYYSFDNLPKQLPNLIKRVLFPVFVAYHIRKLAQQQQPIDVVDASTGDTWLWSKIRQNKDYKTPAILVRDHGLEHIEHQEFLKDVKLGKRSMSWKYQLYRGSIRLWEEATALLNADIVMLLNRHALNFAVEKLGLDSKKARLIVNGIPEYLINLPLQPVKEPIRIAQIGTYIPRKGIQYSVPALNKILDRYPEVEVSFFGTECKECLDREQIYRDFDPKFRDRIQVVPRYQHSRLPELLKGHQIKLLSSTSEAFGMALVEGMACGLAPVTTDTPGPMEIVTAGENAIVIPSRDTEAIFEALDLLISDRSYLETLRRSAHQTAQKYSWEQIAKDTVAIYQEALYRERIALKNI